MTDLIAVCPNCGNRAVNYKHYVDNCGIGSDIPSGEYEMVCTNYGEDKGCGKKFKVRVSHKERVEVIRS